MTDSELVEVEQFKKWSNAILPKNGLVLTERKYWIIVKLLDKMFLHYQDYNQDVVEYSESEQDELILIDGFRSFLEDINPLFIDKWVEVSKGNVTVSRVIYEYLNELAETDPLEGYKNNPLKVFSGRFFYKVRYN